MAKMTAAEAAVRVMEREGIDMAFGIPGAAINPLYAALRRRGSFTHILARHVEGAAHMAEGYTRAVAGNIGVCIGTSGPAGTDMITGLYSASADSIPILCITGQAPRARMHKEDFQAVDIASIAKPVCKWAVTVMEPAQVPRTFQQAFHVMRSGRPGPVLIDLPFDVQMAEIEFDDETYEPLQVYKPKASRAQIEKAMGMLNDAQRPLIVAGGGIINADASDLLVQFAELTNVPVIPTLMGWGTIPDDHPLMAGMVGLQTSHRYGNATMLASDFALGIGNRWANRHTGSVEVYTKGRKFVHVDIEPTQIGRVFSPDYGIASDAKAALELFLQVAQEWKAAGKLKDRGAWADQCTARKGSDQRHALFDRGNPVHRRSERGGASDARARLRAQRDRRGSRRGVQPARRGGDNSRNGPGGSVFAAGDRRRGEDHQKRCGRLRRPDRGSRGGARRRLHADARRRTPRQTALRRAAGNRHGGQSGADCRRLDRAPGPQAGAPRGNAGMGSGGGVTGDSVCGSNC